MAENTPQFNDILLYTAPSGAVKIEVIFEGETFWLSQRKMGELFGVEVQTINYHLKEIFKSGELEEVATIRKIRIVQLSVNSGWFISAHFSLPRASIQDLNASASASFGVCPEYPQLRSLM